MEHVNEQDCVHTAQKYIEFFWIPFPRHHLSVGLATRIPKFIHYRVVLVLTTDSGLIDP